MYFLTIFEEDKETIKEQWQCLFIEPLIKKAMAVNENFEIRSFVLDEDERSDYDYLES